MIERLRLVGRDLGLDEHAIAAAEPRVSHSNETWVLDHPEHGRSVLRICVLGRRSRLLAEAALGREVPGEVGYPRVLEAGTTAGFTWMLTAWLPGTPLARVWPTLPGAARDAAAVQLASRLRALHGTRPTAPTARVVADQPGSDLIGDSLVPLPVPRALALLERCDWLEPGLRQEVAGFLAARAPLAPLLDEPGQPLLHGDLHLDNIWWRDGAVTGMLDLEWARFGPAWVDLARLSGLWLEEVLAGGDAYAALIRGLLTRDPGIADVDHLDDRLRVCVLAYEVRDGLLWADLPADRPDHPARVIERALSGPMLPPPA